MVQELTKFSEKQKINLGGSFAKLWINCFKTPEEAIKELQKQIAGGAATATFFLEKNIINFSTYEGQHYVDENKILAVDKDNWIISSDYLLAHVQAVTFIKIFG